MKNKEKPKSRDEIAREKVKEKFSKKKIIIYGAPCHKSTGNGKLIKHMAKSFQSAGHEVFTIGIEYNGPQIWEDGIPILPGFHCEICGNVHKGSPENVKKITEWLTVLNIPKPIDYFICVGDPIQPQQFGIGTIDFKHIKVLMYATLDSHGLMCNRVLTATHKPDYLTLCDKIISTAKFTQEQFKEYTDLTTDLIYECIDLENYKPVPEEIKIEMRKKHRFKPDDFIIYYSGRCIGRKRHNILLDACAKFLCETENTYLYLNIPHYEDKNGEKYYPDIINPIDFIQRVLKHKYGKDLITEKRIVFADRGALGSVKIDEQNNAELYQLSDIHITTTSGEGFGLTPAESNACGVPAIVPDNSTGREILGIEKDERMPGSQFIFGKGGLLTRAPIELWAEFGLKQFLTTPDITYNAIKFLYKDPELRKQMGKQGREYVEKMFNVSDFRKKWLDIIINTEKKKKPKEEFKKMEMGEKEDGKKNN